MADVELMCWPGSIGLADEYHSIFHQFYYPHDAIFIGDFATLMSHFVNFMRCFVFIRWDFAKLPFNFESRMW